MKYLIVALLFVNPVFAAFVDAPNATAPDGLKVQREFTKLRVDPINEIVKVFYKEQLVHVASGMVVKKTSSDYRLTCAYYFEMYERKTGGDVKTGDHIIGLVNYYLASHGNNIESYLGANAEAKATEMIAKGYVAKDRCKHEKVDADGKVIGHIIW